MKDIIENIDTKLGELNAEKEHIIEEVEKSNIGINKLSSVNSENEKKYIGVTSKISAYNDILNLLKNMLK